MRRTMETRTLTVQLSDEQVEARSRLLARKSLDLNLLEAHIEATKESHKALIKGLTEQVKADKGELRSLAEAVSKRAVRTDVDCDWHFYLGADESGVKVLVRRDTGEAVDRRPLTVQERQLVIGEKLEEATADQLALWEEQLAKAGVEPVVEEIPLDPDDEAGDDSGWDVDEEPDLP